MAFPMSVLRQKSELVVPTKPTPIEIKEISDLDDQHYVRRQVPVIMFYKQDSSNNTTITSTASMESSKDPAKIIRNALAETLVLYYPLAGRLIEGPNGKLMVSCAGQGVLFVAADADVTLDYLGNKILPPCPYLDEFLHDVPHCHGIVGCPLIFIQVTRFTCGGFSFAIRMNHVMMDGQGLAQFLEVISEFARGELETNFAVTKQKSPPPIWNRDIFNARHPPLVTCSHIQKLIGYAMTATAASSNTATSTNHVEGNNDEEMENKSFFLGPKEISAIRSHISPQDKRRPTTFEVIAACLWKCRTMAEGMRNPIPSESDRLNIVARLFITFNLRGKPFYDLPRGYYGNAFVVPIAMVSDAKLLMNMPLSYAIDFVQRAKSQVMDKEFVPSYVDLLVMAKRPMVLKGWTDFVVTDNIRVGFDKIDFGWGKPIYGGPTSTSYFISVLTSFKNDTGEDGILVLMCLPLPVMESFQQQLEKMTQHSVDPLK